MESKPTAPHGAPALPRLPASRPNVSQRRELQSLLVAAGAPVTVELVQRVAREQMKMALTPSTALKVLEVLGYVQGGEVALSGTGDLKVEPVWVLPAVVVPQSPMKRAQALSDRMQVLAQAYVDDLMADPLAASCPLNEVAVEATRSFSLAMCAAVSARARFGAKTILPQCGDTAVMAFRSGPLA